MAMIKKRKKTMSTAQKKALAKGRAALKAKRSKTIVKRKKRKAVAPVRSLTKTKGTSMAKKKTGRVSAGGVKKKVRRSVSRARNFLGKGSGAVVILKDAALAVGGGVAAGILANKLPIQDPRLKAAAPIAAGVLLATTIGKKNAMLKGFATGMVVLGGVSLLKQLAPQVPMLAGEQEMMYLPQYPDGYGYGGEMVDLGLDEEEDLSSMGENVQLGEEYYSPADL